MIELPPLPPGAKKEEAPPLPPGATRVAAPPLPPGAVRSGAAAPPQAPSSLRPRRDPLVEPTAGNLARSALEIGKGMVGGVVGLPGDIETAARTAWANRGRLSDIRAPAQTPSPSVAPTPERVERSLFGAPSGEVASGMREVGRLLGPTAASKMLGMVGRSALGTPTESAERLAAEAEKRGFRLEPMQTRQDSPRASKGPMFLQGRNQTLANEEASAAAGRRTGLIDEKYLQERLSTLGRDYDNIFNRPLSIDRQLVSQLEKMRDFESAVAPATAQSVSPAAANIIRKFNQAAAGVGGNVSRVRIDGRELQALRTELSNLMRSSSDGPTRYRAAEFVRNIDDAIGRAEPQLARQLAETNRRFAATKTLEGLVETGGIQNGNISLQKLGERLANEVYGFGSATDRHPLSELGRMGVGLRMLGRFERAPADIPSDIVGATATRLGRALGVATSLPGARTMQRAVNRPTGLMSGPAATGTTGIVAGEASQQFSPPQQPRNRVRF